MHVQKQKWVLKRPRGASPRRKNKIRKNIYYIKLCKRQRLFLSLYTRNRSERGANRHWSLAFKLRLSLWLLNCNNVAQYRFLVNVKSNLGAIKKILAEEYKKELISKKVFENSIVTEILKINVFYPAENYHHNYYNNNKNQGYCRYVIQPKIEKYKKIFSKNSKTK